MPVPRYLLALGLETAGIATAVATVLGIALAWLMENRQFAGKQFLRAAANGAIALPAPLVCYYLFAVGHIGRITLAGLSIAGVISALPLFLRSVRSALAALNPAYGKAARSLGASEWRVFARVDLPLILAPIGAAAGLALLRVVLELAVAFRIAEPGV